MRHGTYGWESLLHIGVDVTTGNQRTLSSEIGEFFFIFRLVSTNVRTLCVLFLIVLFPINSQQIFEVAATVVIAGTAVTHPCSGAPSRRPLACFQYFQTILDL